VSLKQALVYKATAENTSRFDHVASYIVMFATDIVLAVYLMRLMYYNRLNVVSIVIVFSIVVIVALTTNVEIPGAHARSRRLSYWLARLFCRNELNCYTSFINRLPNNVSSR
jgi:hypothetical protein